MRRQRYLGASSLLPYCARPFVVRQSRLLLLVTHVGPPKKQTFKMDPLDFDNQDDDGSTAARTMMVANLWKKGAKNQILEPEPIVEDVPQMLEAYIEEYIAGPPIDPIPWHLPVFKVQRKKHYPNSVKKLQKLYRDAWEDDVVKLHGVQRFVQHPFEVITAVALANAQILQRIPQPSAHSAPEMPGVELKDEVPVNPYGGQAPKVEFRPTLSTCHACKTSHVVCSGERPCTRCSKSGRECLDVVRKKRGRPTNLEKRQATQKLDPSQFPVGLNII